MNPMALLGMIGRDVRAHVGAVAEAAADAELIGPPEPAPAFRALFDACEGRHGLPGGMLAALDAVCPIAYDAAALAARDTATVQAVQAEAERRAARLAEHRARGGIVRGLLDLARELEPGSDARELAGRIVGAWQIFSGRRIPRDTALSIAGAFNG